MCKCANGLKGESVKDNLKSFEIWQESVHPEIVDHRMNLLSEIIAMLAPNIEKQRRYK